VSELVPTASPPNDAFTGWCRGWFLLEVPAGRLNVARVKLIGPSYDPVEDW